MCDAGRLSSRAERSRMRASKSAFERRERSVTPAFRSKVRTRVLKARFILGDSMNAATMAGDVVHELAHGASDPVGRELFGERRLPNGKEAVGRARHARARQIGFTRRPIGIETEREHDHAGFAAARVPFQPCKPVRKGAAHNGSPGDTNRIWMTFGAPTSSGCSA